MQTVWKYIRQAALALLGLVVSIVIVGPGGNFVTALFEERGWLQHPNARVGAVMSLLSDISSTPWFHWVSGGIIGFTIGIWLDFVVRRRELAKADTVPAKIPTSIKLQFNAAGVWPYEVEAFNVHSHYELRNGYAIHVNDLDKGEVRQEVGWSWDIFLVFDKDTIARGIVVDGHGAISEL